MSKEEYDLKLELQKMTILNKSLIGQIEFMTSKQSEMCKKTMKLAKLFGISERKLIEIWKEL